MKLTLLRFSAITLATILLLGAIAVPVNSSAQTPEQTAATLENFDSLGQEISNFLHQTVPTFKQQRDETVKIIKECRESYAALTPEERTTVKQDCRIKLDGVKEKYKTDRDIYKNLFKEFNQSVRILLKEVKGIDISDQEKKATYLKIKEKAKQKSLEPPKPVDQISKDERKSIKELRKTLKKELAPVKVEQEKRELELKKEIKVLKNKLKELKRDTEKNERDAEKLRHAEQRAKELSQSNQEVRDPVKISAEDVDKEAERLKSKTVELEMLLDKLIIEIDELGHFTGKVREDESKDLEKELDTIAEDIAETSADEQELDENLDDLEEQLEEELDEEIIE